MGLLDIFRIGEYKRTIEKLNNDNSRLQAELLQTRLSITPEMLNYISLRQNTNMLYQEVAQKNEEISELQEDVRELSGIIAKHQNTVCELSQKIQQTEKSYNNSAQRIASAKEIYKAVVHAIELSRNSTFAYDIENNTIENLDKLFPSVTINLHCMDVPSLKKAFNENDRQIELVMREYAARYTTKANQTIYQLMVIALRAELQNILYDLKYNKIDQAVSNVKEVTQKYIDIVCKGNQQIAPTVTRFIGEIEYLFINAVKIEYNYYVKREQARQEQAAIREQMRQEAEERKALEAEKRKVEAEERKYTSQIEELQRRIVESDSDTTGLQQRILELEQMLAHVELKKNDIINLQNGKAGNVYIISNYGAFGDQVFKIGMTRRLDPQERIDELGSASVPFKFDVHSFIFSEDAVALETELHRRLDSRRVNKVNMRKEFFYSTVDELETLTHEIAPTAEFHRTMIAEEYNQSLSSNENYTSSYSVASDESDE